MISQDLNSNPAFKKTNLKVSIIKYLPLLLITLIPGRFLKERKISVEEIARKSCEYGHSKMCEQFAEGKNTAFSFEEYWERNIRYFTERAKIY
jgi:hypothetical protein